MGVLCGSNGWEWKGIDDNEVVPGLVLCRRKANASLQSSIAHAPLDII